MTQDRPVTGGRPTGSSHRTAIVTGASRGIGPHIARSLSASGTDLLLVARSQAPLVALARELRDSRPGSRVAVAVVDLSAGDAPARVLAAAERELGHVDVLVNNAALEPQVRFHTLGPEEIGRLMQVNLLTPVVLSRLLLPGMLERGYGRIINISSMAGHTSFPLTEGYAAAKDGLTAFSRVLRSDYRNAGVSASSLILGPVKGAGQAVRTAEETGIKTGPMAGAFMVTPDKVARAVGRAIRTGRAELVIMPGPGRLLKALMDLFPGLGPAMNRISGADRLMSSVADYRERERALRSGQVIEPARRNTSGPVSA